jgi:multidrug efflux pump subunit AcrA (membrane-fusion protein)
MTVPRFRRRRASLPFFAVALLAPLALDACAKKPERQPRPVATVSVVQARRATVPYVIEANGVVTPMQSASLLSQVDGIITSVEFAEGQEVRAGQPLFRIDPRPYQNTYAQAGAVLARDSATYRNALANADRSKTLLSQKVITQQEADVNVTAAATAEATLRADLASVEQAKFNLENTIIRAPIGGKTGSLLVRKGNLVRAGGATALVVIHQVRPILVRFAIPSSQLSLVLQYGAQGGLPVTAVPGGIAAPTPSIDSLAAEAMAQPADAQGTSPTGRSGRRGRDGKASDGGGSGVSGAADGNGSADGVGSEGSAGGSGSRRGKRADANGSLASRGAGSGSGGGSGNANGTGGTTPVQQGTIGAGEQMMGKLSFIDNAVDTATGTVQLKATFDNSSGRLWVGQFATTSLHLFDEQDALVVPQQAVVTGQRGSYVYIVDHADTARQRAITVERTAGGLAIITSGVREGDRVVTEGQSRLTPDAPIRLRGASDSGGGGGGRRGRGNGGGVGGGGKRGGGGGGA